jgi:hypothetical protein
MTRDLSLENLTENNKRIENKARRMAERILSNDEKKPITPEALERLNEIVIEYGTTLVKYAVKIARYSKQKNSY